MLRNICICNTCAQEYPRPTSFLFSVVYSAIIAPGRTYRLSTAGKVPTNSANSTDHSSCLEGTEALSILHFMDLVSTDNERRRTTRLYRRQLSWALGRFPATISYRNVLIEYCTKSKYFICDPTSFPAGGRTAMFDLSATLRRIPPFLRQSAQRRFEWDLMLEWKSPMA
jgi:hypothetical protein